MEESQEEPDPFSPNQLGNQETTKVPRSEKLSLMLWNPAADLQKRLLQLRQSLQAWQVISTGESSLFCCLQIPTHQLAAKTAHSWWTTEAWQVEHEMLCPCSCLLSGQASNLPLPNRQGWTLTNLWYVAPNFCTAFHTIAQGIH